MNRGYFIGAELQNLLKLFEWIFEGSQYEVDILLPQSNETDTLIIY